MHSILDDILLGLSFGAVVALAYMLVVEVVVGW